MFIIYKSNKLDILLSKICPIIQKKPLTKIFEKEIFIHDSKILFQYLNIFIANTIGISANIVLDHPNNFILKLFQNILNKKNIKNKFTQSIIMWNIINALNKKNFFSCIKKKDNISKKFKFAYLMSKIFEQYIIYRPNWINSWEEKKNISLIDKNAIWQIELWQEIIKNIKKHDKSAYHILNLFNIFQNFHNKKKIKKNFFPSRFFIISSFSLNPFYIKIFKIISQYTNVYFLYLTPFKNNIFHLNSIQNKNISKIEKTQKNKLNNSILSLWGKYEEYYVLNIINHKNTKKINFFKKAKGNNLLSWIKNNLLKFNIINNKKIKRKCLSPTDNSISINICYSEYNEIEILYEQLLIYFNTYPDLKPSDIIVTSYSINNYISSIHSIFNSEHDKKNIPYFISKKISKKTEIILLFFNKILDLQNNRFENEEILAFLDIPEISNHFNISEKDINILYCWIEEANIRWGIDHKHKKNLFFPKDKNNTWMWGIEKLLLSYATNDTENIWNDILPCSIVNNNIRSELIGKLIIFINTLKKWQKKISNPKYLISWRSLFNDLIDDFFQSNIKTIKSVQILSKNWIEMIDEIILCKYKNKISIEILKKNFTCKIQDKNQKFLPGVVNFCHPNDVCYIPFKIICIIGANYKTIPQKNNLDSFINLLNEYPSIGDASAYEKYSHLFLQSISCAQQYFYISYIGYSIKDNRKMNPSILIDQLLNYISFNFFFIRDNNLDIENNKKQIIYYLCKNHKKQNSYKKKKIENNQNIYKKTNIQIKDKTFDNTLLKNHTSNKINLKDLIRFWKNPIRYFFNNHLKIKYVFKKTNIENTEPFSVKKLDTFEIKKNILNEIIQRRDIQKLLEYYSLSGKLPYGFFGQSFLYKIQKEMQSIANLVISYKTLSKQKKVNLTVNQFQINGILYEIQKEGLLRWQPNKINYSDRISLWIEHLIYSLQEGIGKSKIIGYRNQIWSFSVLDPKTAHNYLNQYISGYIKGSQEMILLTRSGASWFDQIYDIKNNIIKNDEKSKIKAYKRLLDTWNGNDYIQGEKEDFYIKQIIKVLNHDHIKEICQTAQRWLLPLLKNKK
ncbi:exodeoxyribonuclease V subunit gamma [Buchnera aphidicola]|uniref:RecBCD enzyme subunit RecC n=1 Tax=Buchnera aphidicola (Lipaphis pseudobrassicae) TaxID=1258543 RepID=A0A4D6Y0T3_9GAMM|nr:exodeoxyribonuclease V subunit gamma [Buchnera aphidicola]QCI22293.1 exodeoxyribonuclease V subunit gamma [Buchnera aphidicola (Lipaphis pseudobrassicae)]